MNPEEQQIAIAEACGWCWTYGPYTAFGASQPLKVWRAPNGEGHGIHPMLPDYLNDLNAMHEAEKMLSDMQLRVYDKWLCGRRFIKALETYAWHATAAQRAEAFLRTIGKWKD